jgi:peptidoglycan/LPS O-acetylase OafA/YrhL
MSFATVFGDVSNLKASSQAMLQDGVFSVDDHIILFILVLAAIAGAFVTIFLFKNRKLQMKLSRMVIVICIISFLLAILLFVKDYGLLKEGTEVTIGYGYLSPLLALIFTILALRYIRKDEKLIRSSDRLR